jgi:sigma-E factor negative regulatory protein RseA
MENMNGKHDETLSALLDDRAEELELRRLLRDMERDAQACEDVQHSWYRQHLVRAVLNGEQVIHAPDFAASVRAAIATDATDQEVAGVGWRRALGSFAVAASVAAVVVVGGQQFAGSAGDPAAPAAGIAALPGGVVNTTAAVPVQASFGTRSLPATQPADRTAYRDLARQRLLLYSQQHAEHTSLNTPQGLLPYARVPEIQE